MRRLFVVVLGLVMGWSMAAATTPWTVQQAARAALENHPASERADAIEAEAHGTRRATLSPEAPKVSYELEGIPSGAGFGEYEERRIAVQQDFDFPLRTVWRLQRENARVESARQQRKSMLLDLEHQVRRAFADAWYEQERLVILTTFAASVDSQANTFQRMNEVGRIPDLDASRAHAEAAEVQADLQVERARLKGCWAHLKALTGQDDPRRPLAAPYDSIWLPEALSTEWQRSPRLMWSRQEVTARERDRTIAANGWLPTFEIRGFRQHLPTDSEASQWGGEIGMSIPFWFALGGVGEHQAAVARERIAQSDTRQLELEMQADWEEQVEVYLARRERASTFQTTLLPTSEQVLTLARTSYAAGRASYVDVLVAQRTWLERRLDYLDTLRDLVHTHITLDSLSGRSILQPEEGENIR
ncbi:TolC family protein [bacterium]|nr:TolC family protein [bacterium]